MIASNSRSASDTNQNPADHTIPLYTHYEVRCCHCSANKQPWGPYTLSYKTSSHYIRHFQKHHCALPSSFEEEERILNQNKKRPRISSNPWTLALKATGTRSPDELFTEQQFRKLLAASIVDTNSPFRIVESKAFNNLLKYCNPNVPILSHQTAARDIQNIHEELFPVIKKQLSYHASTGGRFNLTLDA